jgi:hypothetical protein
MARLSIRTHTAWLAGLGLYSAALLLAETVGSAELARHLCTDIVGPIRFYAVNTSLSASLLGGSALLLVFAATVAPALPRRETVFLRLQALVFLYLALDDRFLLHETAGQLLGVDDAFVLGAVGVGELVLLWRWGAWGTRSVRARRCLVLAGAAFAVMSVLDAWGGRFHGIPRLTLEDLAKTWSAAGLFGFAWDVAAAHPAAAAVRRGA